MGGGSKHEGVTRNVMLVHGEGEKMKFLKNKIKQEHGIECYMPANGETAVITVPATIPARISGRWTIYILRYLKLKLAAVLGIRIRIVRPAETMSCRIWSDRTFYRAVLIGKGKVPVNA